MQVFGNAEPAAHGLVVAERPAAGHIHMLDRIADGFGRQESNGQVRGQGGDAAFDNTLGNQRVRIEGQMRSMLLMGAERQHGDPVPPGLSRKIGRIVLPSGLGHRHFSSILHVNCRKNVI
ncbi:hypothetical protein D3C87_1649360 [compost metagenome]